MQIGTIPNALRLSPRAQWLVTFALVAALTGLWSLATPLFGSADEPAHVVRAASVARGEITGRTPRPKVLVGQTFVRLPAIYASASSHLECFAGKPKIDASCHKFTGSETKIGSILTEAGHHPPAYYAVVGGVSRLSPTATIAVYLMRLTTAIITALFVTMAVSALRRMSVPRSVLVGLAVSLTPMVLAFGSVVTPSALEIAAGIATWACGLVLVSEMRDGKEADRGLVTQLGIAASALVLARQISMLWLALIGVILAALLGKEALRRLFRATTARVWAVVVALCTSTQIAWIAFAHGLDLSVPPALKIELSTPEIVRETVSRVPMFFVEMLGNLGWIDTRLPRLSYILLTAALTSLVLFAMATGTRRYVLAMLVAIVVTVVVPIVLESWQATDYGFYWQGRYTLPFAVGVPLLAVFALQSHGGRRLLRGGLFVPALGSLLIVANLLAFYQALRRWSVGAKGAYLYWLHPNWKSPVPQWLLIGAYSAAFIAFVVWLLGAVRSTATSEPTSVHARA
jgi:hypothetical protein